MLALGLYGFVATLQPFQDFGRILAAYGGVFFAGSLAWGMILDRFRPDRYRYHRCRHRPRRRRHHHVRTPIRRVTDVASNLSLFTVREPQKAAGSEHCRDPGFLDLAQGKTAA